MTGTPGTGKTALSKRLAKTIGANYMSLSQLIAKYGLANGYDSERQSRIVNVPRTRSKIVSLTSSNVLTVIDTHLPEGIVPREITRKVIVLRCHPKILKRRLMSRGWKANKVRENVLAEVLDLCLATSVEYYGRNLVFQLDTSKTSSKRAVQLAKSALKHTSLHGKKIDWISDLEKEGKLDKYLM